MYLMLCVPDVLFRSVTVVRGMLLHFRICTEMTRNFTCSLVSGNVVSRLFIRSCCCEVVQAVGAASVL